MKYGVDFDGYHLKKGEEYECVDTWTHPEWVHLRRGMITGIAPLWYLDKGLGNVFSHSSVLSVDVCY